MNFEIPISSKSYFANLTYALLRKQDMPLVTFIHIHCKFNLQITFGLTYFSSFSVQSNYIKRKNKNKKGPQPPKKTKALLFSSRNTVVVKCDNKGSRQQKLDSLFDKHSLSLTYIYLMFSFFSSVKFNFTQISGHLYFITNMD